MTTIKRTSQAACWLIVVAGTAVTAWQHLGGRYAWAAVSATCVAIALARLATQVAAPGALHAPHRGREE